MVASDFEDLLDRWNELADEVGVVRCRGLSESRKAIISRRWDEIAPYLEDIFEEVRHSKFLQGKMPPSEGHRVFRLDLIRLFQRGDLYLKILEQQYRDEAPRQRRLEPQGDWR